MSFVQEKLNFLRINKNQHVSWWAGVDKISFACICLIVAFSLVMVTTASPAVASRIGVEPFYFIKRQIVFTISGFTLLLIFSNQDLEFCRRIGVIGFFLFLFLLILVLFFGPEVKGARRWINIAGFSLQPSEFIKPFFAVFIAWVMSIKYVEFKFPAFTISIIFYMITVALLMLQPDLGMTMTLTVIYASQLFIAGLSILWIIIFISLIVLGLFGGYLLFPHIKKRIDSFLTPENFENYQVKKSLEAFQHGKLYGVGPGEGTVKLHIPDSHTDFIFSVLGEEMGVIACALLIILFGTLVIRGLYSISENNNQFVVIAVTGILAQIGVQSAFNMGVTLHLLPTKGMTLPLISYGGSSTIAICMALGMLLSFTRRRHNIVTLPTRSLRGIYEQE